LQRGDPAHTEAATVADTVHLVVNGQFRVTRADEIGVQRMHIAAHAAVAGRHQRLAQHVAPEKIAKAQILGLAQVAVRPHRLQGQQIQQIAKNSAHWVSMK
jgi:hypothetical protein